MNLHLYDGKMLTGPELALAKVWTGRFEDKKQKEEEMQKQREFLAQSNFLAMAKQIANSTIVTEAVTVPPQLQEKKTRTSSPSIVIASDGLLSTSVADVDDAPEVSMKAKLEKKERDMGVTVAASGNGIGVQKESDLFLNVADDNKDEVDVEEEWDDVAVVSSGSNNKRPAETGTDVITPSTAAAVIAGPARKIQKRSDVEDLDSSSDEDEHTIEAITGTAAAAAAGATGKKKNTDPVFTPAGLISSTVWNSLDNGPALSIPLLDCGYYYSSGTHITNSTSKSETTMKASTAVDASSTITTNLNAKNTLILKLNIPPHSAGWAINICPFDDMKFSDVYMHFNCRYKKKYLVMNDKRGVWGRLEKRKLEESARLDAILSSSVILKIQMLPEGILIIANGQICDFFVHRRELISAAAAAESASASAAGAVGSIAAAMMAYAAAAAATTKQQQPLSKLRLIVNPRDGNGNQEEVSIEKVWWGRMPPVLDVNSTLEQRVVRKIDTTASAGDYDGAYSLSSVGAAAASSSAYTLRITGLPVYDNLVELQGLEEYLYELMFANDLDVTRMHLPPNSAMGFATFDSAEARDSAVQILDGNVLDIAEEGQFVLRFVAVTL